MTNVDTQLNTKRRTLPRGKWVVVNSDMPNGGGSDTRCQGQFRLIVPSGAKYLRGRFVRVFPDGKRDGTGDCTWNLTGLDGETFDRTWNHTVAGGKFRWDIELLMSGAGDYELRYAFGKTYRP